MTLIFIFQMVTLTFETLMRIPLDDITSEQYMIYVFSP